jgi:hypothetical protein
MLLLFGLVFGPQDEDELLTQIVCFHWATQRNILEYRILQPGNYLQPVTSSKAVVGPTLRRYTFLCNYKIYSPKIWYKIRMDVLYLLTSFHNTIILNIFPAITLYCKILLHVT